MCVLFTYHVKKQCFIDPSETSHWFVLPWHGFAHRSSNNQCTHSVFSESELCLVTVLLSTSGAADNLTLREGREQDGDEAY